MRTRAQMKEELQMAPLLKSDGLEVIEKTQTDKRSYNEQAAALSGKTDISIYHKAHPKPSKQAQANAAGATLVPGSNDVYTAKLQRPFMDVKPPTMTREQVVAHQQYTLFWRAVGFVLVPGISLLGCWTSFSWTYFAACIAIIIAQSNLGIALTYHRMLTHRSFKVHKPLEYLLAYIGLSSMQGSPIEWVSNHRWHHMHTDTPLDPHSPYEGLWHAHFGWLLKTDTEQAFVDRSNVPDLTNQAFYRFLEQTWVLHHLARLFITGYFGLAPLVWLFTVPVFVSWNMAWIVNSACHMWGDQPYDAGDLSTDNWFVNLFAFGDGYHNTHHAFPFSARHGLQWYQWDPSWYIIWTLQKLGLAWDIKLPTARDLERKRMRMPAAGDSTRKQAAAGNTRKRTPGKQTPC